MGPCYIVEMIDYISQEKRLTFPELQTFFSIQAYLFDVRFNDLCQRTDLMLEVGEPGGACGPVRGADTRPHRVSSRDPL